jgi:hypothetical protein
MLEVGCYWISMTLFVAFAWRLPGAQPIIAATEEVWASALAQPLLTAIALGTHLLFPCHQRACSANTPSAKCVLSEINTGCPSDVPPMAAARVAAGVNIAGTLHRHSFQLQKLSSGQINLTTRSIRAAILNGKRAPGPAEFGADS